jgi:MbtH protein
METTVNRAEYERPRGLLTRRGLLRMGGAAIVVAGPARVAGAAAQYDDERKDTTIYKVIINEEEQYSIWPADRELPLGWYDVGFEGTKPECLRYIEEVWTDMRPKSLREKMEQAERERRTP